MEEVKKVYMGKTVPEMIAELEKFDRNFGRYWKNYLFEIFAEEVEYTKKTNHKMNQRQKIESYKLMREYAQELAAPPRVTNYKDMPYEELKKRYCRHDKNAKERKSLEREFPWEWTPSGFEKTLINVCNRVETAVNGIIGSMKKITGKKKKNKEDNVHNF